jgi:pre-mRNA-processing factor SLU7
MTVRNLRIREDTAKYLRNLDPDSAFYDPKTRSMRENPNNDADLEKLTYAGDNFVRMSGDATKVTDIQIFAWQAYERGDDISLQANPSELEKLYKEHIVKRDQEKRKLDDTLLRRYGSQDDIQEDNQIIEESEAQIEFSKNNKSTKTSHSKFNY